ncbi:MAG TPA: helix-turn-helix domain-containing protein [Thermoplasmata archaeon]|nr:helix-turn-helix domain-containing protein [Thermoplasmata archaeon]
MPVTRRSQRERSGDGRDRQVCPSIKSIERIGNELRLVVIRYLLDGPLRFNEMISTIGTIDPKSLSRVLKYLVGEGIVRRQVLGTQPFSVQYSLTEKGSDLRPVIDALAVWGQRWVESLPGVPAAPGMAPRVRNIPDLSEDVPSARKLAQTTSH